MGRSKWKLYYIDYFLLNNIIYKKNNIVITKRSSNIPFLLNNKKIFIYNGIWKKSFNIDNDLSAYKFGSFSLTKSIGKSIHAKKKKRR